MSLGFVGWLARYGAARAGLCTLALASACTVMYDSERKPCRVNDDCLTAATRDVGYSCVESFCERPACQIDLDCQKRGTRYASSICSDDGQCGAPQCTSNAQCGGGVCDVEGGHCVTASQATCTTSEDCSRYEGRPLCVERRCTPSECTIASDCGSASPTMQCNAGKCEDRTWGCIGQPDDRAPPSEKTATLKTTIYNIVTRELVESATVRVCNLPVFDPDCTKPLEGATGTYSKDGGIVVTGLKQRTPFRLKIDFPAAANLAGVDYYSQRPIQDTYQAPPLLTIPFDSIELLRLTFDPPPVIDLDKAHLVGWAFDCEDKPAAGLSLLVDEAEPPAETRAFYLRENGLPAPGRTATDINGGMGLINMKPGKLVPLATVMGETRVSEYRVEGFGRRLTFVHFFPRNYQQ